MSNFCVRFGNESGLSLPLEVEFGRTGSFSEEKRIEVVSRQLGKMYCNRATYGIAESFPPVVSFGLKRHTDGYYFVVNA